MHVLDIYKIVAIIPSQVLSYSSGHSLFLHYCQGTEFYFYITVFLLRVIEGVSGTLLVYKLILLIAITDESELIHNCHDIKED